MNAEWSTSSWVERWRFESPDILTAYCCSTLPPPVLELPWVGTGGVQPSSSCIYSRLVAQRLGRWPSDLAVAGSTPGRGVIKAPMVNSAFHPSGVGKSSTSLHWLGLKRGVFACVGWQVTLCDPIWQATPCSSVMGFPIKNLSWLQLFETHF